jgi:glucose-1-phosphate cytidylyltransferase
MPTLKMGASIQTSDVVILCGGKGTRLREETEIKPKPMVRIGTEPILWHILHHYSHYGFRRFVLALGYKGEQIQDYFDRLRKKRPICPAEREWDVTCVPTGEDTLKGGRLKRVEKYLTSNTVHVTYGDGLSDVDLGRLSAFHRRHGKTGTVTAVRPPSRFGELSLRRNVVTAFEEKPQMGAGFINGGFFIFDRSFIESLSPAKNCDLEFGPLQKLAQQGELRAFRHTGFWQCMDNIRERDFLNELWAQKRAPWKLV